MKKIIFIKLGGSLITDKSNPDIIRAGIIRDIAKQIKKIKDQRPDLFLVIGNGNGSQGHYIAVKYNVGKGSKTNRQKYGFSLVQDKTVMLNKLVTEALLKNKVNAISLHPSSFMIGENGKPKSVYLDAVLGLLQLGMVPVLHGDIVYDKKKGSHIFTTENIFSILISNLHPRKYLVEKVIYLTSVAGFLDNKKQPIRKITKKDYPKILKNLYKTEGFDVTGGMRHKIDEALLLASKKIKVYIGNGFDKQILNKAIFNRSFKGTIVE